MVRRSHEVQLRHSYQVWTSFQHDFYNRVSFWFYIIFLLEFDWYLSFHTVNTIDMILFNHFLQETQINFKKEQALESFKLFQSAYSGCSVRSIEISIEITEVNPANRWRVKRTTRDIGRWPIAWKPTAKHWYIHFVSHSLALYS